MKYHFFDPQLTKNVCVVHINRPPANALSLEVVEELHSLVDELSADDAVRAVIFTAQGPFFIGGADIKMMKEHMGSELPAFMERYTVHLQRALNKVEEIPKPVIAAINGFAAGGGCELALACDFRFMATGKARIGLSEVKLGILPGGGGLQRMPRLVGKAKALELIIEGRLLTAEEALEIGLVNRIYEPEDLMAGAMDYAEKLSMQATKAIGIIKKCIHTGMDTAIKAGLGFDIDSQDLLFKSHDGIEGIEAFISKRPPKFIGK
ncbi:MAG: enoyl-CoA hydratase/isomerase family protein [Desulfatirhabdiaceae bacterium]